MRVGEGGLSLESGLLNSNDRRPLKAVAAPPAKRGAKSGYAQLVKAIESANTHMVGRAAAVNQSLVIRNWLIGAYLVEYEQDGADRAKYGANLLQRLAEDLSGRSVKGCSQQMLERMRQVYLVYPQVASAIPSPLVAGFQESPNAHVSTSTLHLEFRANEISSPLVRKSDESLPIPFTTETVLRFSWTQLIEFIRIADPWKRAFYENECLKGHWSKRQLQRQIESLLYERTGLSTNKKAVVERARRQEPQESIADVLRDPYILEFTGLAERAEYSEDELESALLDHLQRFLLELGRGFCFEARQFRMAEGDNPPVGILLCSDKDGVEVEFATAGMDQKLFVSRYVTALPSVEQLKAFLDRDRAEIEALTPRKG